MLLRGNGMLRDSHAGRSSQTLRKGGLRYSILRVSPVSTFDGVSESRNRSHALLKSHAIAFQLLSVYCIMIIHKHTTQKSILHILSLIFLSAAFCIQTFNLKAQPNNYQEIPGFYSMISGNSEKLIVLHFLPIDNRTDTRDFVILTYSYSEVENLWVESMDTIKPTGMLFKLPIISNDGTTLVGFFANVDHTEAYMTIYSSEGNRWEVRQDSIPLAPSSRGGLTSSSFSNKTTQLSKDNSTLAITILYDHPNVDTLTEIQLYKRVQNEYVYDTIITSPTSETEEYQKFGEYFTLSDDGSKIFVGVPTSYSDDCDNYSWFNFNRGKIEMFTYDSAGLRHVKTLRPPCSLFYGFGQFINYLSDSDLLLVEATDGFSEQRLLISINHPFNSTPELTVEGLPGLPRVFDPGFYQPAVSRQKNSIYIPIQYSLRDSSEILRYDLNNISTSEPVKIASTNHNLSYLYFGVHLSASEDGNVISYVHRPFGGSDYSKIVSVTLPEGISLVEETREEFTPIAIIVTDNTIDLSLIKPTNSIHGQMTYSIYDMSGRLVETQKISGPSIRFNNYLSKGYYFLKLSSDSQLYRILIPE